MALSIQYTLHSTVHRPHFSPPPLTKVSYCKLFRLDIFLNCKAERGYIAMKKALFPATSFSSSSIGAHPLSLKQTIW